MEQHRRTVLVLGAKGRFGNAAVNAFSQYGWTVRAQARHAGAWPAGVEYVNCDAMDTHAVEHAAEQVEVIVHALNPSAYTLAAWRREARQMLAIGISAARRSGALLMLPGNIYNFGRGMPQQLTETTPEAADTPFGQIRRDMEADLRDASDIDSVVLRGGEFFGGGSGVWFDLVIVHDLSRDIVRYPGPLDRVHEWTYVPDFAQTFAEVAARRTELRGFNCFHVPGHPMTGAELLAALERVTGRKLRMRQIPWPMLILALPFAPMLRSLWTMRYVWQCPHVLDGQKLGAWQGGVPHTDLDTVLHRALGELQFQVG